MSTRVAVIGGGAIGLMTAYHLARDGAEVVLVDSRRTGRGAAEVNAGWICPGESAPVPGPGMIYKSMKWMLHKDSPLYIRPSLNPEFIRFMVGMWGACNARAQRSGYEAHMRLAGESVIEYHEYGEDGIDFELRRDGLLLAFTDPHNFDLHLRNIDVARMYDLEPEILLGDDVREREPMLTDAVHGGIYFSKERHLDPNALMRGLHRRLVEMGAIIHEDAPVTRVLRTGDRVTSIVAGGRSIEADSFVLAAGAWSGEVAKLFGTALPVRPGKGYSVDVPPLDLVTCVNLADAKVAVTPLSGRLRLAGTMEFGSLDEGLSPIRIGAILKAPEAYFREFEAPPVDQLHPRAGLRPMTPDGMPIIGALGDLTNAWVSTGHGMQGITLGPGSASLVTDLVLHGKTNPALAPFSPARFPRAVRHTRAA